jgi:hypothetical protein
MSIQTADFTYTADEIAVSHRRRTVIILIILALIPLAVSFGIGSIPGVPRTLIFATVAVLVIALSFIFQYVFGKRTWGALPDQQSHRYEFDQDSITSIGQDGTSTQVNFADLHIVVVTKGRIYLYLAPKHYWLIPWRVFQSPDDADQLEAALRAHNVSIVNKHPR